VSVGPRNSAGSDINKAHLTAIILLWNRMTSSVTHAEHGDCFMCEDYYEIQRIEDKVMKKRGLKIHPHNGQRAHREG
jgi:hypothetical protein